MKLPTFKDQPKLIQPILQAIEHTSESICIADAKHPDLPLIYVNQAFCDITGYQPSEIIGKNCRFLQGEDTDKFKVEELREAIQHQDKCTVELLNYTKDGKPFWNRLSLVPIFDEQGDLTHYVGIQSDITRIKVYERQHEQFRAMRATLETVNDIVVNFLAVMRLYRDKRTQELQQGHELLGKLDAHLDRTQQGLDKLNQMDSYREVDLANGVLGLDWTADAPPNTRPEHRPPKKDQS